MAQTRKEKRAIIVRLIEADRARLHAAAVEYAQHPSDPHLADALDEAAHGFGLTRALLRRFDEGKRF